MSDTNSLSFDGLLGVDGQRERMGTEVWKNGFVLVRW